MTIVAYRERTTGRYPITVQDIRTMVPFLFGVDPDQSTLDAANLDPVLASNSPPIGNVVEGDPEMVAGEWHQTWVGREQPETPPPPEDPFAHFIPVPLLRQRLEKLGMFDDFAAYLALSPPIWLKVLTLERGVDPAYPDLLTAFDSMSVPQEARDYLLADPSVGVPDIPEGMQQ